MRVVMRLCILIVLLTIGLTCRGQQVGGGVIVRIPDGPSPRCINSSTDRIWLTLFRVVTTRSRHWLTTDHETAIVINAQVKTDPQTEKAISFPLMSEAKIADYPTGQISIPVEYTVVYGLNLKQEKITYTGLGLDVSLVNLRHPNSLGVALQTLAEITGSGKLPIPASPYSQSATYLLEFASTAVRKDIESQPADEKLKTGSLALNFDPDGQCSEPGPDGIGFETTGTKALVMAEGAPGADLVNIGDPNSYCWIVDPLPAFVLKATKKEPQIPCADPRYDSRYRAITNNYTAFFLQKRPMANHLGAESLDERDRTESLQRCGFLGIKKSVCPGVVE